MFANVDGFRLFYRCFEPDRPGPVVIGLHGGPGATHDYLLPLGDLAQHGFRVFLYDALGCGRSEPTEDRSLFTLEGDVRRLEKLREALGIERFHVIGSSYGGLLALAYALAHQDRLLSVVTTGGLANVPLATREMDRLKHELPAPVLQTLLQHEAKGEFQHPEYLKAVEIFYHRHVCRLEPWPEPVRYSLEHISVPVYHTMNGPNEFTIVGNIKDIDLTPRLGEIKVPLLVTTGRYDEVTPRVGQAIVDEVPGSRLWVLPESSHLGFWEERTTYLDGVRRFLQGVEPSGHPGGKVPA